MHLILSWRVVSSLNNIYLFFISWIKIAPHRCGTCVPGTAELSGNRQITPGPSPFGVYMDAAHPLWLYRCTPRRSLENGHSWGLMKATGWALVAQKAREHMENQGRGFIQKLYKILMVCPRLLIVSHVCNVFAFSDLIIIRKLHGTKLWNMLVDEWPRQFCITGRVSTLDEQWHNKKEKQVSNSAGKTLRTGSREKKLWWG